MFKPFLLWQGHKDLNPGHAVLETAALPTELYPYILFILTNADMAFAEVAAEPLLFLLQHHLCLRLFGSPIAVLLPLLFAPFIAFARSQTSPTELYPYIVFEPVVGLQGLEPRTDRL